MQINLSFKVESDAIVVLPCIESYECVLHMSVEFEPDWLLQKITKDLVGVRYSINMLTSKLDGQINVFSFSIPTPVTQSKFEVDALLQRRTWVMPLVLRIELLDSEIVFQLLFNERVFFLFGDQHVVGFKLFNVQAFDLGVQLHCCFLSFSFALLARR